MSEFIKTLEILGEKIELGESRIIDFNIAKLYTSTSIEIPIIIERSIHPGPTVLIALQFLLHLFHLHELRR